MIVYFRNFIFGVEDSLVSTVGLLSGIAVANVTRETIFLTGIVLIFVEAFSMAAGSFLSEYLAEEYARKKNISPKQPLFAGSIMFLSYFVSGFIPLFPYIFFSVAVALKLSVILSLGSLFLLGLISGKISNGNLVKDGLRALVVGGIAIGVGVFIGRLVNQF